MDTSETYIKMCKKAEKIQGHSPGAGDYYISGYGDLVILPMEKHIKGFCTYECLYLIGEEDEVWLPRQDQLQEMLGKPLPELSAEFNAWESSPYFLNRRSWVFSSMEQLWLAFVMLERFGKIWDGEDWVNGN